jgi:hypothetical protein
VRLAPAQVLALFALGAAGGLLGDQGHVASGTTAYLAPARTVPFIWKSPFWFPLLVGALTAGLGELRLQIGGTRRDGCWSEAAAAAAAVLGLYALTALIRHEALGAGTLLVYSLAALVWRAFGGGIGAAACGAVAVLLGVTTEIVLVAAGVFRYAHQIDVLAGVPPWLPALYFAFGVVVARLVEPAATARARETT